MTRTQTIGVGIAAGSVIALLAWSFIARQNQFVRVCLEGDRKCSKVEERIRLREVNAGSTQGCIMIRGKSYCGSDIRVIPERSAR